MTTPRVVVVRRRSEYDELIARHGTRGQAEFFLSTRGESIDGVLTRHTQLTEAVRRVQASIPADWRRAEVEREELSRFVFEEAADIIVVVGQDGLVANVAKYLADQPVIGVNPLPENNIGVLVPHRVEVVGALLTDVAAGRARYLHRAMVQATLDDGQELTALNEIFVGQESHQSAVYELGVGGLVERQSSSGVIVGTGTGSTGWCASIQRASAPGLVLPGAADRELSWFVREPWPSPTTGVTLSAGLLTEDASLELRVGSPSLVVFGDGIEADRLVAGWGQHVRVGLARRALRTVV